jgi:hypothetical protein
MLEMLESTPAKMATILVEAGFLWAADVKSERRLSVMDVNTGFKARAQVSTAIHPFCA